MNIPENIIAAHKKWMDAESKVPEHEYEKAYKSRSSKARKLYRVFAALCKESNLQPVATASFITNGSSKHTYLIAK